MNRREFLLTAAAVAAIVAAPTILAAPRRPKVWRIYMDGREEMEALRAFMRGEPCILMFEPSRMFEVWHRALVDTSSGHPDE